MYQNATKACLGDEYIQMGPMGLIRKRACGRECWWRIAFVSYLIQLVCLCCAIVCQSVKLTVVLGMQCASEAGADIIGESSRHRVQAREYHHREDQLMGSHVLLRTPRSKVTPIESLGCDQSSTRLISVNLL
jgi:hypothetical protein